MPDNPPKDGRPEVQIRSGVVLHHAALPEMGSGSRLTVNHEVACVWCPWSAHTPDVRDAVKTADDHEQSLSHTHSREEALAEGRSRRELWD
jgi:hypothetical protein